MKVVAKWWRWSISKSWKYATKSALTRNVKWAIKKEILILQKLNNAWIQRVPQIHEVLDDWFTYEWIEWNHFDNVHLNATDTQKIQLWTSLLSHAYTLDKLWVVHGELHRPTKNVLVWKDHAVYIIDFERWTIRDYSGKNMKAVGQRMSREGYFWIQYLKDLSWKQLDNIYESLLRKIQPSNNNTGSVTVSRLLLLSVVWVTIDLLSKHYLYSLERGTSSPRLQPVLNYGSARSLPIPHWITRVWALGVVWRIGYEYTKKNIWIIASSLIIAWAVWNSIDRIFYGWVRDFFDITSIIQYPIFNIADCMLVGWVVILIFQVLYQDLFGKNHS